MPVRDAITMGLHGTTWQARGYAGAGNVEGLIGSLHGRPAIVCGNAATVFEELEAAQRQLPNAVLFAVNDIGMYLPKVDHWVSLHAKNLGAWEQVRRLQPRGKVAIHAQDPFPYVDYAWERLRPVLCLSGYFAMTLAWIMGAELIVLCGCPGDPARRFFEAGPRADGFGYGNGAKGSDTGAREQMEQEMTRVPELKAAVRSMGGSTRSYFGGL